MQATSVPFRTAASAIGPLPHLAGTNIYRTLARILEQQGGCGAHATAIVHAVRQDMPGPMSRDDVYQSEVSDDLSEEALDEAWAKAQRETAAIAALEEKLAKASRSPWWMAAMILADMPPPRVRLRLHHRYGRSEYVEVDTDAPCNRHVRRALYAKRGRGVVAVLSGNDTSPTSRTEAASADAFDGKKADERQSFSPEPVLFSATADARHLVEMRSDGSVRYGDDDEAVLT
ncbi:MAG: hypothetical protein ACTHU0_21925 [Kofleriaceae bacterium]